ncbi:MAG: hypothetical protein AB1571_02545 [Nanoarchaeota archaeon]
MGNKSSITISISIPIWIVVGIIILGAIISGYLLHNYAIIFSGIIAGMAIITSYASYKTFVESKDEKKIEATFDYMRRWNDIAFFESKANVAKLVHSRPTTEEVEKWVKEKEENQQHLLNLLNFFEEFAIAIHLNK